MWFYYTLIDMTIKMQRDLEYFWFCPKECYMVSACVCFHLKKKDSFYLTTTNFHFAILIHVGKSGSASPPSVVKRHVTSIQAVGVGSHRISDTFFLPPVMTVY